MSEAYQLPVQPSSVASAFEAALIAFLAALRARNHSEATLRAYATDICQFSTVVAGGGQPLNPAETTRHHVLRYLTYLSARNLTGVTRARKLSVLREFFRFLESEHVIRESPVAGIESPRKERTVRRFLWPEEYTRLLSHAGVNPRDYCILMTFLQTGVRVSELCGLNLEDVDIEARVLHVRGKGLVERDIDLEERGISALASWLNVRPSCPNNRLFLNRYGEPLGTRGVRKLVARYCAKAGITRRISCHSFRHTFATQKVERGVSPFILKEWLGHRSVATTQIYVHLNRQGMKKLMEATGL